MDPYKWYLSISSLLLLALTMPTTVNTILSTSGAMAGPREWPAESCPAGSLSTAPRSHPLALVAQGPSPFLWFRV